MWMGLAVIMMSIRQLTVLMAWRNTFKIVIQVPERILNINFLCYPTNSCTET